MPQRLIQGEHVRTIRASAGAPSGVEPLTGNKVLTLISWFKWLGIIALVMGTAITIGAIFILQDWELVSGLVALAAGLAFLVPGIYAILISLEKVVVSPTEINHVNFLGKITSFKWNEIYRITYWGLSESLFVTGRGRKFLIPLAYRGLRDLVDSLKEHLKPEVYKPIVDIMSLIIYYSEPPHSITGVELQIEKEKRLAIEEDIAQTKEEIKRAETNIEKKAAIGFIAIGILAILAGVWFLFYLKNDQDLVVFGTFFISFAAALLLSEDKNRNRVKNLLLVASAISALVTVLLLLTAHAMIKLN